MEVLIKKLHQKRFDDFEVEVVAAITNKPDAKGIKKADDLGIDVIMIDHKSYDSREAFDMKLVETLQDLDVDLTILAGFMRILTPVFTDTIKAINIHPALLPLYKGADALKRSFEGKETTAGVTAHLVVSEVDGGEMVLQKSFDKTGMDFDTFEEKIHACEHEIFPKAVIKVLQNLH